jgi:hypothetical protein
VWLDEDGVMQSATLPVHVETEEDLLPPEEFRSLTADAILDCLLSGREPAEWVEALDQRQAARQTNAAPGEIDSLRAVDTSGYVLYRTRRLGAALTALGERLVRTVRTRDAMTYRLRQDPLGPLMLAETLIREWQESSEQNRGNADDLAVLLFNLAEIKLMLAHVGRTLTESLFRPLFRQIIEGIDHMCNEATSGYTPPPNLRDYLDAVKQKHEHLLPGTEGEGHAS